MTEFLVKVRGEPKGPYSVSQLQTQIRRKRLSRQHQISSDDGMSWQRAGDVDELFTAASVSELVSEAAVEEVAAEPAPTEASPAVSTSGERLWSYAVMGQELGPVPESEIRILIASGGIAHDTLLWQDGMTDWVEVQHIPAFSTAVRSRQSSSTGGQESAISKKASGSTGKRNLHWPSLVAMLTAIAGWTVLLLGALFSLGALRGSFSRTPDDNVLTMLFFVALALSPSLLCCMTSINLGHKAQKYANEEPGQYDGTAYSIFALVLGYITAISLLGLTIFCIVSASR